VTFNSEGSITSWIKQKYNDKKKPIQILQSFDEGSYRYKTINKFDDNGRLVEEIMFDSNDKIIHKITNKYNELGKLIERLEFDDHDILTATDIYKYDTEGNEIESLSNTLNTSIKQKRIFINDTACMCIVVTQFTNDKFDWNELHKYDRNGNEIEHSDYDLNGLRRYCLLKKYDKWGNIIDELSYFNRNLTSKTKYIYF